LTAAESDDGMATGKHTLLRPIRYASTPRCVTQRDLQAQALATAHAHEGNIDEACRIGVDALALADRQQVTINLQDVRRLRLDLEPWRDTQAVRELDEQLAATGGAR
jgi:hypothetical protein